MSLATGFVGFFFKYTLPPYDSLSLVFIFHFSYCKYCKFCFLIRRPTWKIGTPKYVASLNKVIISIILLCPPLFLLCAETISDYNTTYIPCAILELFGTIPESGDIVEYPTLRRTILGYIYIALALLSASHAKTSTFYDISVITQDIYSC